MSDQAQEVPSSGAPAPSLGRFMTSEVFELVANDDVRFYVNKDILASKSKPFREATSGTWKESTDRRIDLKDWDSDTVARLVEFLYVQNYPYPDPTPLGDPEHTVGGPEALQPTDETTDSGLDPSRPLTPLGECLSKYIPPEDDAPITDEERLEDFDPADYDYEDILLAHAKVYALANYKSVDTLRTLALKRLLLALSRIHPIQPASHISLNVVDLASYVYANTDHLVRSEEPLRKLTSQFIALNFAAFQTEPKAVELVAKGGDFVKDIMAKICRRIPEPEGGIAIVGRSRKGYISGIKVVYGNFAAPPPDRVTEITGGDCNISNPYQDPHTIWLVPEYTKRADEACTGFSVLGSRGTQCSNQNLDRMYGGDRYLVPLKASSVPQKITEVALVRWSPYDDLEDGYRDGYRDDYRDHSDYDYKAKGYDGISGEIGNHDSEYSLHLLWKTVKPRRV